MQDTKANIETRWSMYSILVTQFMGFFSKFFFKDDSPDKNLHSILYKKLYYNQDFNPKTSVRSESSTLNLFSSILVIFSFLVIIVHRIIYVVFTTNLDIESTSSLIWNSVFFPLPPILLFNFYILSKRKKMKKAERQGIETESGYLVNYNLRDKPTNFGIIASIVIGFIISIAILFI